MLTRPRFQPHLHVESVEGEGVFLMSETGVTVLAGQSYQVIAPFIDGRRSVDEIVDLARERLHPVHVYHTIADLEEKGHLTESGAAGEVGDVREEEAEAAWWSAQKLEPRDATARLTNTVVNLSAVGEVKIEPLHEALRQLHVRTGEPAQLGVVITDDYLRVG